MIDHRSALQSGGPYLTPYAAGQQYAWSVCSPLTVICNQLQNVMAMLVNPDGSACLIPFGTNDQTSNRLLGATPEDGLQLKYAGGDPCGSNPAVKPSTILDITCDIKGAASPHNVQISVDMENCQLNLAFQSSAGCPLPLNTTISPIVIGVIVVVGALVAYLMFGILYKTMIRGASGIEAVPNVRWACIAPLRRKLRRTH